LVFICGFRLSSLRLWVKLAAFHAKPNRIERGQEASVNTVPTAVPPISTEAVSMQLKNHEWTLMNTNLRTRTMIQPFAPQSLNDGRESRRKGTPILWFHWCLFVFIGGLTASFRISH
jgi:hypothetical protein